MSVSSTFSHLKYTGVFRTVPLLSVKYAHTGLVIIEHMYFSVDERRCREKGFPLSFCYISWRVILYLQQSAPLCLLVVDNKNQCVNCATRHFKWKCVCGIDWEHCSKLSTKCAIMAPHYPLYTYQQIMTQFDLDMKNYKYGWLGIIVADCQKCPSLSFQSA